MDRALPETVRRPDGRAEPFEPERISRSLFAAAERLGCPDAFLARELTDGVLHFLLTENVGAATTPERIAEIVGKVVRELGHPALALAYEDRAQPVTMPLGAAPAAEPGPKWPPSVHPALAPAAIERDLGRSQLRSAALQVAFPRDLAAAHAEGLIGLDGLEHPFELAGVVATVPPGGVLEALDAARRVAGSFVAMDGPEYDLAHFPDDPATLAAEFLREARFAADTLGLTLILNLNCRTPPPRLHEPSGPLFAGPGGVTAERRQAIALGLAEQARDPCLRVWWHVAADAVRSDATVEAACRLALGGQEVEFVFDRPRAAVALGPGVDRATPGALIQVRLNLGRLIELAGGEPLDPEVFLRKVGSLARFAKTAGHVKQDFLRRHGREDLRAAFLLDRARLALTPAGLFAAARASGQPPVEFAREVLRTIRVAAETDRPRVLPVFVDMNFGPGDGNPMCESGPAVRTQLRAASALHTITGAGRFDLVLANVRGIPPADGAEIVRAAADTSVVRMRLVGK